MLLPYSNSARQSLFLHVRTFLPFALILLPVLVGLPHFGANELNLICIKGAFSLDETAGLTHLAGLNVLRDDIHALDNNLTLGRADLEDLASLAAVLAVDDDNLVTGLNMNLITHRCTSALKHFGSQRENLEIIFLTQLSRYRSKDTSAFGIFVFFDDNSCILIEGM